MVDKIFLWTRSFHKMLSESSVVSHLKGLCPFSNSAVEIHDSQAYRHMDITSMRIIFIFDPRDMFFLSLHIGFSFVRAVVVCAILTGTSGFESSSETTYPRYFKLSSFRTLTLISLWMSVVLFVISWTFSALIFILYIVQVLPRHSTRASNSCFLSSRAPMSANHKY